MLCYAIRNSFLDKKVHNAQEKYCYYLNLSDMIDFASVDFFKTINLKRIRNRKLKDGYKEYRLDSKEFDLVIGKRVVEGDSLLKEDGKYPVFSANVYDEMGRTDSILKKEKFEDFNSPSVLWGIDGDWMVNYIPANQPFYPTDHCGVLRINSDDILPEYVKYALEIEGKFERFSRTNRASIDRIKLITIHIPKEVAEQKRIVNEINEINMKIEEQKSNIAECDSNVKSKFVEMFNMDGIEFSGKTTRYPMIPISEICYDYRGVVMSAQYIQDNKGKYPVYSSQTSNDGVFGYIDKYTFDGEYITWTTDGANAGTVFYRKGKFNCTNVCGILEAKDDSVNMLYLSKILGLVTHLYVNHVGNDKLMNGVMKKISVPIPPKPLQDKYALYIKEQDKLKFTAEEKINELKKQKESLIEQYFE